MQISSGFRTRVCLTAVIFQHTLAKLQPRMITLYTAYTPYTPAIEIHPLGWRGPWPILTTAPSAVISSRACKPLAGAMAATRDGWLNLHCLADPDGRWFRGRSLICEFAASLHVGDRRFEMVLIENSGVLSGNALNFKKQVKSSQAQFECTAHHCSQYVYAKRNDGDVYHT